MQGKLGDAETYARLALDSTEGIKDPKSIWRRTNALNRLGEILRGKGDYREAKRFFEEALQYARADNPTVPDLLAGRLTRLGVNSLDLGDVAAARSQLGEARRICQESLPKGHGLMPWVEVFYARAILDDGDAAEAERIAQGVLETAREMKLPTSDDLIAYAENVLGGCLVAQGRYEAAEPLLLRSSEHLEKGLYHLYAWCVSPAWKARMADWLVRIYEAQGDPSNAAEWRAKRDEISGSSSP